MREFEEKKKRIMAIREAIANMNLEEDCNMELNNINIEDLERKILILGGYYEKVGGLSYSWNRGIKKQI